MPENNWQFIDSNKYITLVKHLGGHFDIKMTRRISLINFFIVRGWAIISMFFFFSFTVKDALILLSYISFNFSLTDCTFLTWHSNIVSEMTNRLVLFLGFFGFTLVDYSE